MKKFIYKNKNLRCKITYVKLHQHYQLQLQRRSFLFWFNTYNWMNVKDGYWGESRTNKVMKTRYEFGNICERYPTGQLNIPARVQLFFDEYYNDLNEKLRNAEIIKQIV